MRVANTLLCAAAATSLLALAGSAQANPVTFVDFQQEISGASNVFVWNPTTGLDEGTGAHKHLLFHVLNPPVLPQDIQHLTLDLSGFASAGSAFQMGSTILQPVGTGSFKVWDETNGKVWLTGTVDGGQIVETQIASKTQVGGVLSGDVTYTGGELYNQYFEGKPLTSPGSFSFTLTGIKPSTSFGLAGGLLKGFSADGTGSFTATAVPVPLAVWGGMGLLGLAGGVQFRKNRREAE